MGTHGTRGLAIGLLESDPGWHTFVVQSTKPGTPPDALQDSILATMQNQGIIGAHKRNATADLLAGKVRRPLGAWGLLVRLAAHDDAVYLISPGADSDWAKNLTRGTDLRTLLVGNHGMTATLYLRAYEAGHPLAEFAAGLLLGPDFAEHDTLPMPGEEDDGSKIALRGKDLGPDWLKPFNSAGAALDALVRKFDAFVPALWSTDGNGTAGVGGRTWIPSEEDYDNDETGEVETKGLLQPTDFARVDLLTFGDASTLEPSAAAVALTAAIHAGDAAAARAAIQSGASPQYMTDDEQSPLWKALALGNPFNIGRPAYSDVSRDQQAQLVQALVESGADVEETGREQPAIHWVLHWCEHEDEGTPVRLLKILLDAGANPNSRGAFLKSTGQTALHLAAARDWPAVASLLLKYGADPKAPDRQGRTPLQIAQNLADQASHKDEARAAMAKKFGQMANSDKKPALADFLQVTMLAHVGGPAADNPNPYRSVIRVLQSAEAPNWTPANIQDSDIDAFVSASAKAKAAERAERERMVKDKQAGLEKLLQQNAGLLKELFKKS